MCFLLNEPSLNVTTFRYCCLGFFLAWNPLFVFRFIWTCLFILSEMPFDIFSGIYFFWCQSFTTFKESMSNASWLNIKIQHRWWNSCSKIMKTGQVISVGKSEKMCLSQNFSKIWDVESQKWQFLCSYVPEFYIYVSIHRNNTFPGGYIWKSVWMYLSHARENWKLTDFHLSLFFFSITTRY